MKFLRTLAVAAFAAPLVALASGPELHLDKAPVSFENKSLQNGAKLFVNYCLSCHGASYLRYNRLRDIGLTEDQIRDNLMFTAEKVGEPMKVAIQRDEAKQWFGVAPPDLTVIARARASEFGSGADWLYTYLRSFYRDDKRPTGWNNTVFENVGMPHVLWELQGQQVAHFAEQDDGHGNKTKHFEGFEVVKPGSLNKEQYDQNVADLVSFIVWMGEPAQQTRKQIGLVVIGVLLLLAALTYLLKKAYWKDVH
ncbi:cytochrome c1 [Niveibacterium umoris]|uniref:Ubiquinol-cytochrome c reductase cytochrome c1 subunit n=1 Tax=Niveibacterium umoris TaxID=1193620 RepID=A0A840BM60_9RHOO|nr:cytochrome c1 [Niveibacterium umoris]MBB4012648.1 ubiquinol-cytochrome c reductase cytochrome c1 subunit [Niveibacterium umoris]